MKFETPMLTRLVTTPCCKFGLPLPPKITLTKEQMISLNNLQQSYNEVFSDIAEATIWTGDIMAGIAAVKEKYSDEPKQKCGEPEKEIVDEPWSMTRIGV